MTKEVFDCYSCGGSSNGPITPDCICDPDGLEYMKPRLSLIYTREGYPDRIVDLTEMELKIISDALHAMMMSSNLEEGTNILRLRNRIPYGEFHVYGGNEVQCYCELCCSEGHCSCEGCNEPCTCGAKFCPRCGGYYTDFPALSRVDNKTSICSPCGTEEAIQDFTGEPLSPLTKEQW